MTVTKLPSLAILAERLIKQLGNLVPTVEQIKLLEDLLSNIIIQTPILLDTRLTHQETQCLLLAAYGKTIAETAQILDIAIDTVKEYRSGLLRKLECTTIAQAVYQGIRYGYLNESTSCQPHKSGDAL